MHARRGTARPGVTSGGIRETSPAPRLAQGPRPRATKCPRHPGTPLERGGGARGRRGGGLGAGRGAHRAAPGARGRRNRSETAQVPLGETVQGDPGDPPGRSEPPSGQPQQPLDGAGWLDWPAGTSRGRRAASRLSGVMKYPYRAQIRRNLVWQRGGARNDTPFWWLDTGTSKSTFFG